MTVRYIHYIRYRGETMAGGCDTRRVERPASFAGASRRAGWGVRSGSGWSPCGACTIGYIPHAWHDRLLRLALVVNSPVHQAHVHGHIGVRLRDELDRRLRKRARTHTGASSRG